MITRQEVEAVIEDHFGIEVNFFKNVYRYMYMYSSSQGFKRRTFTNLGHSLLGSVGDAESFEIVDEKTIKFYDTMRYNRKYYAMNNTLTLEDGKITMRTEMEYLYAMAIENFDLNDLGIKDAMSRMKEEGLEVTNETVAEYLSFQERYYELDEPDADVNDWEAKIHVSKVNGMYRIEGTIEDVTGNIRVAQRNHWELWPEGDVVGIPHSNKSAGEQFGGRKWFLVTTDLRVRDVGVVQIMNPKNVKIKLFTWVKDSDGDLVMYKTEKIVDMSDILPVYDYFLNLA